MLKLEKFPNIIQYAVYTHPYRLCIYYANSFWESTNKNANLSLGTGMGFSYCVHLIIKPKTWQFWVIRQSYQWFRDFRALEYRPRPERQLLPSITLCTTQLLVHLLHKQIIHRWQEWKKNWNGWDPQLGQHTIIYKWIRTISL